MRELCRLSPATNSITLPDPMKWKIREAILKDLAPIYQETAALIEAGSDIQVCG